MILLRAFRRSLRICQIQLEPSREREVLPNPPLEGLKHARGRISIPCKQHKACFSMYRWLGEENDLIHLFPVTTWIAIGGFPLHHQNQSYPSKLMVKCNHVIKVSEHIIDKSDIEVIRVYVGCEILEG